MSAISRWENSFNHEAAKVADRRAEQEEGAEGWLAADGVADAIRDMEQGQ